MSTPAFGSASPAGGPDPRFGRPPGWDLTPAPAGGYEPPIRLLLIGPLPPPIGGATKVFSYLVEDLKHDPRVVLRVINTSRRREGGGVVSNLAKAVETIAKTLVLGLRSDVISFHANERARIQFGPVMYLLSRVLRRPLIVRAFGGMFDKGVEALRPWLRRLLERTYLRSEVCLLETKWLVEYFGRIPGCHSVWFPNCTPPPPAPAVPRAWAPGQRRRVVFLGRMIHEKGVDLILDAQERLASHIEVDMFGPLSDAYTAEGLNARGNGRVRYGGCLSTEQVAERLWDYDALICPTFWHGEGYPGVVLEAFTHGLPVVASRWGALVELVDETCGILVEPKSLEAFAEAVNRLLSDDHLYRRLREGSLAKGKQYLSSERTNQFVELCRAVMARSPGQ